MPTIFSKIYDKKNLNLQNKTFKSKLKSFSQKNLKIPDKLRKVFQKKTKKKKKKETTQNLELTTKKTL